MTSADGALRPLDMNKALLLRRTISVRVVWKAINTTPEATMVCVLVRVFLTNLHVAVLATKASTDSDRGRRETDSQNQKDEKGTGMHWTADCEPQSREECWLLVSSLWRHYFTEILKKKCAYWSGINILLPRILWPEIFWVYGSTLDIRFGVNAMLPVSHVFEHLITPADAVWFNNEVMW